MYLSEIVSASKYIIWSSPIFNTDEPIVAPYKSSSDSAIASIDGYSPDALFSTNAKSALYDAVFSSSGVWIYTPTDVVLSFVILI